MQIVRCDRCNAENIVKQETLPPGWDEIEVMPYTPGDANEVYQLCHSCMFSLAAWISQSMIIPPVAEAHTLSDQVVKEHRELKFKVHVADNIPAQKRVLKSSNRDMKTK